MAQLNLLVDSKTAEELMTLNSGINLLRLHKVVELSGSLRSAWPLQANVPLVHVKVQCANHND
jgi:hypothetical protein